MTVQEIIDAIRPQLYPYQGAVRITNKILLELTSSADRTIYQEISRIAPELLGLQIFTISVNPPNNPHNAGYGGGSGKTLINQIQYKRGSDNKVFKVRIRRQGDSVISESPAVWIKFVNASPLIFPIDPYGKNWEDIEEKRPWFSDTDDEIILWSVPAYTSPSTLSSNLNSPNFTRPYIEAQVLLRCLHRVNGVPDDVIQRTAAEASQAYQAALMHAYKISRIESTIGDDYHNADGSDYGSFLGRLF